MGKSWSLILIFIATAAVACCVILGWQLFCIVRVPPEAGMIHYSGKQIDLMSETAKALIPTVTGFAVLAASGAGYLQQHAFAQFRNSKLPIYFVFASLVASLAC